MGVLLVQYHKLQPRSAGGTEADDELEMVEASPVGIVLGLDYLPRTDAADGADTPAATHANVLYPGIIERLAKSRAAVAGVDSGDGADDTDGVDGSGGGGPCSGDAPAGGEAALARALARPIGDFLRALPALQVAPTPAASAAPAVVQIGARLTAVTGERAAGARCVRGGACRGVRRDGLRDGAWLRRLEEESISR
jgi:hypothetical protein